MTSIAYPQKRNSLAPFLILIALAILGWFMLASAHALLTHGQAALTAADCFNGGGTIMPEKMQDPLTGRIMSFCKDKQGGWWVSIDACDGGNVTCFPRSFAKSLRDCLEYAKRTGYKILMAGELP
jgi:hypothetical protein